VLTPGGYATMGFGPPAALGAKIAAPDRVVISMVGDGSFGIIAGLQKAITLPYRSGLQAGLGNMTG
jgi:thiamine pyrophosphate-dependent acetolactate synthase large subunit-like protein